MKERKSWRLYVDGRCVRTLNDRTLLGELVQIIVGRAVLGGNVVSGDGTEQKDTRYFVGQLDEMALYNRALSAEEVLRHCELVKPNR